MARKDRINEKNLDTLRNKTSMAAYGIGSQLDDENDEIKNIIQQTIKDTKEKIGERTNEKPINYFNEINFGNAFSEIIINKGKKGEKQSSEKSAEDFKRYMNDNSNIDVNALLMENSDRVINFNNYRIINKHIPECAQALNIYKDNIMSPDDYTKLIFNVSYEKAINKNTEKIVNERIDNLTLKYELEDKADKIIGEALMLGESYYACISLEDELSLMLSSSSTLNEELIRSADENSLSLDVLSENIDIDSESLDALNEAFTCESGEKMDEKIAQQIVAKCINENVIIGSSKELLIERFQADNDSKKYAGLPEDTIKLKRGPGRPRKNSDTKPMYVNGSALRYLQPERVCELKIDNICYGYYYAEEVANNIPRMSYLGASSGRNIAGSVSLATNNTVSSTTMASYTPASSAAGQLGVGEGKLALISKLFLNSISKKIDKDFVRKNKEFKDFIYNLVRQDFIIKKCLKLTYFRPDEVIKFECEPVYKDITFFAKLYLSILTNNLLIKLGRAHDKRVFYINTGLDAAYEEAIQGVIQDVKTKDYKMESLNDFNTVLNLTPGRFDDYFMPQINGEKPVEIETLPGMDVDMNNEFVEYLKNSMMSGMGVPRNLIDVTSEVDYARSISAMNANFVRSVIRYQKKLAPSFTRLYQKLYKNEYRFNSDQEDLSSIVDISSIRVQFPSPATLAMTNITEQIQAVDVNADFIANQLIISKPDGSNDSEKAMLKTEIVKDLLPSINWDKYEEMLKGIKIKVQKEKIEEKANPPMDPYAGQY